MSFIKIGNYQINVEGLKGITFEEAKEILPHIPERTLQVAYDHANPFKVSKEKPKTKKKSTKKSK